MTDWMKMPKEDSENWAHIQDRWMDNWMENLSEDSGYSSSAFWATCHYDKMVVNERASGAPLVPMPGSRLWAASRHPLRRWPFRV